MPREENRATVDDAVTEGATQPAAAGGGGGGGRLTPSGAGAARVETAD